MDWTKKLFSVICMVLGFLSFLIFFQGSAFPVYGGMTIPTLPHILFRFWA
jgi:hypothetical protein